MDTTFVDSLTSGYVMTAADDGILVDRDGHWTLTSEPADLVPDSYLDWVSRRPATMGAPAAHITRVAAVADCPRTCPCSAWQQV